MRSWKILFAYPTLVLIALLTALPGCATPLASLLSSADDSTLPEADQPMCLVEIHPAGGSARQEKVLIEPGVSVQGVLHQTGLDRKFRDMEITLVRAPSPEVPTPHKMGVKWDRNNQQVTIDSDYALLPGDVVIVSEVPWSMLDRALSDLLGPLGHLGR